MPDTPYPHPILKNVSEVYILIEVINNRHIFSSLVIMINTA